MQWPGRRSEQIPARSSKWNSASGLRSRWARNPSPLVSSRRKDFPPSRRSNTRPLCGKSHLLTNGALSPRRGHRLREGYHSESRVPSGFPYSIKENRAEFARTSAPLQLTPAKIVCAILEQSLFTRFESEQKVYIEGLFKLDFRRSSDERRFKIRR